MKKPASKRKRADRVVRYNTKNGPVVKRYPAYRPRPKPKQEAAERTLGDLVAAWQLSQAWRNLAETTKVSYEIALRHLKGMESVPVMQVTHADLLEQVDAIALHHVGAAGNFATAVGSMLTWALRRNWVDASPARQLKNGLKFGHYEAWKREHFDLAMRYLPEYIRRAVVLAANTAQRCSDLAKMQWSQYDGKYIWMGKQKKTGEPIVLPVSRTLKAELDEWAKDAVLDINGKPKGPILLTIRRNSFSPGNLSALVRHALAKIPGFPKKLNRKGVLISALTLHGVHIYAIHCLAYAGSTTNEISRVSGHNTLRMVQLYTRGIEQQQTAEAAIAKLDAWQDAIDAKFGKTGSPLLDATTYAIGRTTGHT